MNETTIQPEPEPKSNSLDDALEAESIRNTKKALSLLEWLLLLATAVGSYMAITSQLQAAKWRSKRAELEAKVGRFPIDDATQYHVQLVPSDNPREYRWRVHAPTASDYSLMTLHKEPNGGSGRSTSGGSVTSSGGLITLSFGLSHSSVQIQVRERFPGTVSTSMSNSSSAAIKSMIETNDTSSWTIAGRDGIKKFGKDEMVWLLRIETDHDPSTGKPQGLFAIGLGSRDAINKAQVEVEK